MGIKKAFGFIVEHIAAYLSRRFTGKIIITLNIKNGNIGTFEIQTGEQFNNNDIA